jgi:predicted DNA-binding ArsR family transcriptional regulator
MNESKTSVKIINTSSRSVTVTKNGHPPVTFTLFNGLGTGFADATELRQMAHKYRKDSERALHYADLCEDAAVLIHLTGNK